MDYDKEEKQAVEAIDRLRADSAFLILCINKVLEGEHTGYSVASLVSLRAAKADAARAFSHIIKAGEVLYFGSVAIVNRVKED